MTKTKTFTRRETLKAGLGIGAAMAAGPLLSTAALAAEAELPRLSMGYIFTTHHTPLLVAAAKGQAIGGSGAYMKEMVPKQKYELIGSDGAPLAVISLVVSKSGSETATLFAQGRMDLGVASSTAFMSGIDRGTPMKMLCPLHTDGLAMVFPPDSTLSGWKDVERYIRESKAPVRIGYHSPTSAPRVVFEGALRKAGFKVTQNANEPDADILLVDLKTTANLIPALTSGQVDCWVGPEPHPAVAEFRKVGHVALDSRQLPPKGAWENFPCCVMGASDKLIAEHPAVVQAMTDIITASAKWSNENKAETATVTAEWIAMPREAVENSTIVYTSDPSSNWIAGEGIFLDMLNSMNKLRGSLQGKAMAEAKDQLFDFSFVKKSLGA